MKKSLYSMSIATLMAMTSFSAQALDDSLVYVAVDPCRIVDTRAAAFGPIITDTSRNFLVSGTSEQLAVQGGDADCLAPRAGSKPLAISAYVLAVSAPGSTAGVLTAFPAGQPNPPAGSGSTVNFSAQQNIGNTTTITLCDPTGACPANGEFAILARSTDQHTVIDVQGYFYPATGSCSDDMVAVGSLCVDKYEASVWDAASDGTQLSAGAISRCAADGSDCGKNAPTAATTAIYARSVADGVVLPNNAATWYQAEQACANAGKRLPTTAEWQAAAAGTPPNTADPSLPCNTGGTFTPTGSIPACVSTAGAFDMVGNVMEWSADLDTVISSGFTSTDDSDTWALGESQANISGTPSTRSIFVLTGGPIAANSQVGFRCVR